jgi:hypothetical protein
MTVFNRPSIAKNGLRSAFDHLCDRPSIAMQSVSIALPQSPPYPLVRLKALARALCPGSNTAALALRSRSNPLDRTVP